ncbi:MAG: hypothetical protein LBM18_00750 [Oscillospiraceae bacterium]|jgi:hypothetical protein|nr:hypothetical protein [Oscillospiraceae bacterium]
MTETEVRNDEVMGSGAQDSAPLLFFSRRMVYGQVSTKNPKIRQDSTFFALLK